MTNKKTVKLNQEESEKLMPIIREFNKITRAVNALLGQRYRPKNDKFCHGNQIGAPTRKPVSSLKSEVHKAIFKRSAKKKKRAGIRVGR